MVLIDINKLKQKAGDVANKVGKGFNATTSSVENDSETATPITAGEAKNEGNHTNEFANNMMSEMLKGVNVDAVIKATEHYGQRSGKDVSATVKFLNNLKLSGGNKLVDIARNAPLPEILDTVETVARFVPGIGGVATILIKVLRLMIKLQPAETNSKHCMVGVQNSIDESNKYTAFIPTGNNTELVSLRAMVDIALEDGALTDEEETFLLKKADAIGLDKDLFIMGLQSELKKRQK